MSGKTTRLLLVETVIDHAYRAVFFPIVHGLARRKGAASLWVRFAALARVPLDSDGIPLPAEDLERLRACARKYKPTHVLFNHRPADPLLRALDEEGTPRRYGYLGESSLSLPIAENKAGVRLEAIPTSLPGTAAFLGVKEAPEAAPDYGWVAGNEGARILAPNPYVILGVSCRYNKPFSSNPFFHGVDLSGSPETGGCSFCRRSEYSHDASGDILPSLRRQLSAIEKTCPRSDGRRLQIWVLGERAVREIEAIADAVARLRLRPADFKFETRADILLSCAKRFEKALRRLDGSGHRFSFGVIGIENFVSEELARYNKGTRPGQNLRAVKLLQDWNAEFPAVFTRDEARSCFTMITFNPWTRPEELDLNVSVNMAAGLGLLPGLSTRLRMTAGSPLEAKARREGLVMPEFGDSLLDTGRLNLYAREIPWRFKAPEMEAVERILIRFSSDLPPRDPLTRAVGRFVRKEGQAGLSVFHLARFVVLAAQRAAWAGDRITPMAVLGGARALAARWRTEAPGADKGSFFWRHVAERVAAEGAPLRRSRPAESENPVLLLWGDPECWVELRPVTKPAERFRYRAGRFSGSGPDIDAVLCGDELELGRETALIRKEGRPYASLSGRAFLWWRQASFQRDFWRALLELRGIA